MKVIFTLIISIVLCLTAISDLNSQTQARILSLAEETASGQYIARDWIEMQRGFSFTATSPTPETSKKVTLKWYLSSVSDNNWKPFLTLNATYVTGNSIGTINIGNLTTAVYSLVAQLSNTYGTGDGWNYYVNLNTTDNYAFLEITHPSDFNLEGEENYDVLETNVNYTPATDGTFTAMIDKNLILDAAYLSQQPNINREPDFSLPVGTIPGMLDVSATGAATYSIPIEVPPGTMGMQPQLAVVYNSQGGNGLLGMGFDLSGLSVISRTNKTWYSNNSISGVTFTSNDIFMLDGNRLVLTSGTYGSPNSVYATENETFSRITAYGTEGSGPEWFVVETKDGKTLEYGKEEDARLSPSGVSTVLAWRLNKVSDANGNYIRFVYRNEEYESVISRIEYTGNDAASLEPYNTIEFLYAVKEDSRKAYIGGRYINQSLILESIRVNHEDDLIREYLFYYTQDVYSHLSEVKLRNGDNERLNSTIFNWGEYNKTLAKSSINLPADNYQSVEYTERFWTSGDVNGDGVSDLISLFPYKEDLGGGTYRWKNVCQPFYSLINNNAPPAFTIGTPYEYLSDEVWSDFNCFNSSPCVNNINGDNKPDVIIPYFNQTSYWSEFLFIVLSEQTSQGARMLGQSLISSTDNMPAYAIEDLNNDGIDDIIFIEKSKVDGVYPGKICYRQNNWLNTVGWETFNVSLTSSPEKIIINDLDADGLNEVMIVTADNYNIFPNENGVISTTAISTSILFNSTYDMEPGDFNGDGLIDFICTKHQEWFVVYGNGQGGFSKTGLNHITHNISVINNDGEEFLMVTDFNNDGKSDFIVGDINSSTVYTYWYTSIGDNFVLSKTAISSENSNVNSKRLTKGDFNGDGREDIIYYGYDFYEQSTQDQAWRQYCAYDDNADEGRINAIVDGYNRKAGIHYLPLSRTQSPSGENFYTKGTTCVYPLNDIQAPLNCLWKVTISSGDGTINSTSYSYSEAKIHNQGLGFLGFKEVTAQNETSNRKIRTISTLHDNFHKTNKREIEIRTSSGEDIAKEEINYSITVMDGKYFSAPSSLLETDYLTDGTIETTYSYESDGNNYSNGNIAEIYKSYGNGFTEETTFSQYMSAGSYATNKPRLITTTRKHPDDANSFENKTYNSYDAVTGRLLSSVTNYQISGQEVTITYSNFNNFGQPGTVTQSAPNLTNMVNNYLYDEQGLYVEEETNTIGTIAYESDPATGKTISVTGINGKTAYSYYDNWGVLEKSLSADSVSTYYKTGWAEGNGPENALYYSITQPEGQPWVKTWYDAKGRVLREESIGFNNISIYTDFVYTPRDEVDIKTTYMGGVVTAQVDYEYFDDGRLESETYLGGKVVSYQYNGNTVEVTTDNKTYSKTYDKWGNVTSVEEPSPGGQITYKYYSNGKPAQIISPSSTISMAYDEIGNQTMLTDPDAGTSHYGYDALDRLIYQSDNKGNVDSVHYDYAGRIDYKKNNNEKTGYEYIAGGNGIGQLKKITAPNGSYEQYDYDEYGRTVKTTKHIDNSINDIVFEYSYNEMGQTDTVEYPGNYEVIHGYDNFGNLVSVKNGTTTIWELNQQTASKLKYFLGNNGMYTEKNFDANGFMTSCITKIGSNELQNQHYVFNPVNGLLTSRSDERSTHSLYEAFDFDDLYRLTSWDVTRNGQTTNYSQTYKTDASGNIGYKSGMGNFYYEESRPHVLETLTTVAGSPTFNNQAISYTGFNKVYTITENDSVLTLTYGPDQQRVKSALTDGGTPVKTWYYGGLYEKEEKAGGTTRELLYIPAGDGLAAVYIRNSATGDSLFFLHTDHLGSIVSITDEAGNIIEEYSYDPWGRRRDPLTWELVDNPEPERLTRGFTGHEHLDVFGLINMNGRVYDPMLGLFLSPDNYIQSPDFSQNFNRYGYCLNNPLIYTDPDGEWVHIVIGAAIGGIVNLGIKAYQGKIHNFGDGLAAFGIGAVAGAVGAATGGASFAAAGGAAGGAGGFFAGAAGGMMGSAFAMPIQSMGNTAYFGDPMMTGKQYLMGIGIGGLLGGTTNGAIALFNGKTFWAGNIRGTGITAPGTTPALRLNDPEVELNADGLRTQLRSMPDMPEQQTFLEIKGNDFTHGKLVRLEQIDFTLSPKQSAHYLGNISGKSPITIDATKLLNDLNKGNFQFVQLNARSMPIVKFNYNIGEVISLSGQNLGVTSYGTVHLNSLGQVHVVPWLPF